MARSTELKNRAAEWILQDPDPLTRAELQHVLEDEADASLEDRMKALEFGTAGLRGVVGAGPGRMNSAVVRRVTRALADSVLEKRGLQSGPVVLGYDGRTHSRAFAEEVAGVLCAAGLRVLYFPESVPTPLVGFAVLEKRASAGIVITASHNGPEYNGYKVYGSDGIQILSPWDTEIAERSRRVGPATSIPVCAGALSAKNRFAEPLSAELFESYAAAVMKLRGFAAPPAEVTIVYTPLHGVGWSATRDLMQRSGYTDIRVVAEQARPDGNFPTVPSPNPEEEGVLERAFTLGVQCGADLVIANDPDADRLAVGVPHPSGGFVQLTGNQVGLLLADDLLSRTRHPDPVAVSTVVSSPMLEAIADSHGARVERTLTGFKWVCSAARELEGRGLGFVFGYEEALGYCPGRVVRDKDGLSSALLIADLASRCLAEGSTLLGHLHALYRTHGMWVSAATSVIAPPPDGHGLIERAMKVLAQTPPQSLCGHRVVGVEDFRLDAQLRPRWQPAAALLRFCLERGGRIHVRPSGTEPKLKIYVDLCVSLDPGREMADQEGRARAEAAALGREVLLAAGLRQTF